MSPPNSPPKEPSTVVLSTKLAFTLPVVLIVIGIVSSNVTMMVGMSGKTDVLETKIVALSDRVDTQVGVISGDVAEIKKALTTMSAELTSVRVELATMKAARDKDGG